MKTNRKEQIEALQVLGEFQNKIIGNTEILIDEMKTSKKKDTDDLLKSVTDALNWEMSILNNTLDFINEKDEILNKRDINDAVIDLSRALQTQKDDMIAAALEKNLLPMLQKVKNAVQEVCSKEFV